MTNKNLIRGNKISNIQNDAKSFKVAFGLIPAFPKHSLIARMTPEQLLSFHSSNPERTSTKLSHLSSTTLTKLVSSLATYPDLIQPLWTYTNLHTQLLALSPPPQSLRNHLQTLSHTKKPLQTRLHQITTIATIVFRNKNYALVPSLLQALSNIPGAAVDNIRTSILKSFFATVPPRTEFITPLLELRYANHEYPFLIAFIVRALKSANPQQHAMLLQPILSSKLPLTYPITIILSNANKSTLIALEAYLLDNDPSTIAAILIPSIFTKSISVTSQLLQSMFILLMKADQQTKQTLTKAFEKLLNPSTVLRLQQPAEGSSTSQGLSAIFIDAVRNIPPGCEQHITEFLEASLWTYPTRNISRKLLEELFIWHPNSRTKLLKSIISALSTPSSKHVHVGFMDLFKRLALQPSTAMGMRSCIEVLKESLDYVSFMPVGVDAAFTQYLSSVMATIPTARDRLMMFLRKVSGARSVREQRIACHGLISVLSADAEDLHKDACEILVLLTEGDEREYLVGLLLEAIQRSAVPVNRIGPLLEAIMERLAIAENGSMDICQYFRLVDGDCTRTDPLPLYLRIVVAARGISAPFLQEFLKYLCDEQGAIKHACASDKSPVRVSDRLRLLCDLLETVIGLELIENVEAVVRVYGISIVLRDLFAASGDDDNTKQITRHRKDDDECLMTMRQAAAANRVGGSLSETRDAELLSLLTLRIHALSAVESISSSRIPASLNIIRSEILASVETDIRSVLELKEVSLGSRQVDSLLSLIRKFFVISSPWSSLDQSKRKQPSTSRAHGKDDGLESHASKSFNDDAHDLLAGLALDSDTMKIFEESNLLRLQEESRIRVRQSSLGVLCILLSRKLVRNDVAFLLGLTEGETATENDRNNEREISKRRRRARGTAASPAENLEHERVLVVSRIASLFRREFANSLSISLTLSYLRLLGNFVLKECKDGKDTTQVRKVVSNTLMSILREYSIRHQSVMRSILKLLADTFDPVAGVDFAKSLLSWLGSSPCLLNSKFVETDESSDSKLRVDEFDRDIVEEAIALDAEDESEEEEVSDLGTKDYPLGQLAPGESGDGMYEESPLGEPNRSVIQNPSDQWEGENTCLDSTPRIISDDADPVMSLCLDETPEIALLSLNSALELCEHVIRYEAQEYHHALKSTSDSAMTVDLVAEAVCGLVKVFCDTPFMRSFVPKRRAIPALLLRRLSGILQKLMEIAQLAFQLLLKMFRSKARAKETEPYLRTASSILNILYQEDMSEPILSAALRGEKRSSRTSLQEGINVDADALFRYGLGKDCHLDEAVCKSLSALRKVLKSRKNRLQLVHSVKTPWTESLGSGEPALGDYYRVYRPEKRQRVRSRNPDVDEWLRDEKDGDNYADLEDFVVAMDADEL